MAEKDLDEIETEWTKVGDRHWRAYLRAPGLDRDIVHEYLGTTYTVVEVDKLFEEGKPVAVFRSEIDPEVVGAPDNEEELAETLRTYAFDGEHLQLTEEFEASRDVFESE